MCLFPTLIKNPKYKVNKKNGGNVPPLPIVKRNGVWIPDTRKLMVPVGCQKCMECMKQRANGWRVRMLNEVTEKKNGVMVTLTFSTESLKEILSQINEKDGYAKDNQICTKAIRLFTERWRKKYGKTIRHWMVTELGGGRWEHVHMHGVMFTDNKENIEKIWGYGDVHLGTYCNERTINYIVKYIHKQDEKHSQYTPIVLASKGLGKNYLKSDAAKENKFKANGETKDWYRLNNGYKTSLPIYYRNYLYTEEQREKLWEQKLDKNVRYVLGQKIDISKTEKEYYRGLQAAQEKNRMLGFGEKKDWKRKEYEDSRRNEIYKKRLTAEPTGAPQRIGRGDSPDQYKRGGVEPPLTDGGKKISYNSDVKPNWQLENIW